MSRSGYSYDLDPQDLAMWRGQVASAIRGRRGQAFLREMLAALDAMSEKRLIVHDLVKAGEVCAIGAVAAARQIDVSDLDPEDGDAVGELKVCKPNQFDNFYLAGTSWDAKFDPIKTYCPELMPYLEFMNRGAA